MKDYYKILELNFGADISNIKRNYRKLALKYHPDRNKEPNATQKFIIITEAYEVLNNETRKREYDKMYIIYFNKNQKNASNANDYVMKEKEWEKYGKNKAQEYASMKFDEFADRIIDEIKIGISYVPNLIFILFAGFGAIASFSFMIKESSILGFIIFIMYAVVVYFLYDRAKKDYIAERRIKIINKYK